MGERGKFLNSVKGVTVVSPDPIPNQGEAVGGLQVRGPLKLVQDNRLPAFEPDLGQLDQVPANEAVIPSPGEKQEPV